MRGRAIWLAIGAGALLAARAPAQDPLAAERTRLAEAKAASRAAEARAAALDRQARQERDAAAKARAEEAAVAQRIDRAEADIAAARARVAIVDRLLAQQRASLGERQAPVARLLATLTELARRPTVAAIAQPGSVDDLVHVRAVLGSTLPVVRERTVALREGLARTRALQADAALAAQSLRDGRIALLGERRALAALQAKHASAASRLGRDALVESDRAIALGEEARDIVDRMAALGQTRATLDDLARLPAPPTSDRAATTAPAYRLPVAGRLVTGLGEVSDNGVRARGLTLAVAPGATVTAPAAGRVVFARRFRNFGTIVILNHGAGWTTLLTGLNRATVARGALVPAGRPVGRAAAGEGARIGVELRRRGQPVDIAALAG